MHVGNEATPLSDLISRCAERLSDQRYQEFLSAFLQSEIGVVVESLGTPALGELPPGTRIQARADEFGYGLTHGADGRKLILACADFHAFRQRFGGPYNATVLGRELLLAIPTEPALAGIQVNSAASEQHIVIARDHATALLGLPGAAVERARPWWKFWG